MKDYLLQQQVKRLIKRNLQPAVNWRPIKNVLLLHANHQNLHEAPWLLLTEELTKRGVHVSSYTFFGAKEEATALPEPGVLTPKNIKWLGFPKQEVLQKIKALNIDLCIDIVDGKCPQLELLGLSLTGFPVAKIGISNYPYHLHVQPVDGKIREAIATFIHILTASKNIKDARI